MSEIQSDKEVKNKSNSGNMPIFTKKFMRKQEEVSISFYLEHKASSALEITARYDAENSIAGSLTLSKDSQNNCYWLADVDVFDDWQDMGIGTDLIRAALKIYPEQFKISYKTPGIYLDPFGDEFILIKRFLQKCFKDGIIPHDKLSTIFPLVDDTPPPPESDDDQEQPEVKVSDGVTKLLLSHGISKEFKLEKFDDTTASAPVSSETTKATNTP